MQELDVRLESKINGGITDGCIPSPFPFPYSWSIPQPYPGAPKEPREV
jgi:hypothetical protein